MQEKVRKNFAFVKSPETGNASKKNVKTSLFQSRPKLETQTKNFENFAFFKSPETGNINKKKFEIFAFSKSPENKNCKKNVENFCEFERKKALNFLRIIAEQNCEKKRRTLAKKASKFLRIWAKKRRIFAQ